MSWCDPCCPCVFVCVCLVVRGVFLCGWVGGCAHVRVLLLPVAGIAVCANSEVCASQLSCCGRLQSFARAGVSFHSQR